MAARSDLKPINVNDFRAGIYDDWFGAGGIVKAPPGAAQLNGTFGCCASRSGALVAAPRRVNRLLESFDFAAAKTPDGTYRIMAFKCMSPVWDRSSVAPFESGEIRPFPDNLGMAYEWYSSPDNVNYTHHSLFRVHKEFKETAADPVVNGVPVYDIAAHSHGTYTTRLNYGFSGIDLTRDQHVSPTVAGYPIFAFVFTSNKDVREYQRKAYPDTSAAATDSSIDMTGLDQPGGFAGYAIFAHQDRLILLDRSININAGLDTEVPTDLLAVSAVNDVTTNSVPFEGFVAENPGLFGAWATVNASEAFFVKQQRGGFVARGDILTPQIIRLPGLPPTFDGINIATAARDGRVYYGSSNGVFAWSGGDTAELVSAPLNGWFWKPTDFVDDVLHCKGSFATVDRYLFTPNNYFYDIEQKGWWRLNDPTDPDFVSYAWHDVSASGAMICVPNHLSVTQDVLADYYDIYQGQSEYQWTSQAHEVPTARVLEFRELSVKLQGIGSVSFEISGVEGEPADRHVFDVDSMTPVIFTKAIGQRAFDAVVSIHSIATDVTADPAPSVLEYTISYREHTTAAGA